MSPSLRSGFPYVKMITPENMVGYSEFAKVAKINKAFEDAYKSPQSVIVIDEIERLLDYVPMGQRYATPCGLGALWYPRRRMWAGCLGLRKGTFVMGEKSRGIA